MAKKYLDDNGLLYFWLKIKTALGLKLNSNAPITGATKTKITYDSNGLVTGGADATTADIADSTNKRYVTDAQKTVLNNTSGTNSGDETATTTGALINTTTAKTTPVDADMVGVMDSGASNILKKMSWANIKATLKTYFDTLYATTTHNHDGAYTAKNTAITAATKAKITYDAKGLVTAGADLLAADIPDISATYVKVSLKGQPNGVATLDGSGLIPSAQLPSFVDDVVEFIAMAATAPATCSTGQKYFNSTSNLIFTATGSNIWSGAGVAPLSDKIYVDTSSDLSYRWGGSVMVAITSADTVSITNAEIDTVVAS